MRRRLRIRRLVFLAAVAVVAFTSAFTLAVGGSGSKPVSGPVSGPIERPVKSGRARAPSPIVRKLDVIGALPEPPGTR